MTVSVPWPISVQLMKRVAEASSCSISRAPDISQLKGNTHA